MLKCKTMHRKNHIHKISFNYDYNGQSIPYDVWMNDENGRIDSIVFLGTVQIGKLARWVAEACPPYTAVVQGAPHWHAKKDGSDISEYVFGYTKSVFDTLVKSFSIDQVDVIADSQAVPGVLQLFAGRGYENYLKNLVLTQPLGLNAAAFDGDDDTRFKTFKQRIIKNAYHQVVSLLVDGKLRHNHRQISKTIDFRNYGDRAQYNSGLKHDAMSNLKALSASDCNIAVLCGGRDEIFPAAEIRDTLAANGLNISVHEVAGVPHSPLATYLGRRLLNESFRILEP